MTRRDGRRHASAATRRDSTDPRLRGRAYALPFGRVWSAVVDLLRARSRWTVRDADPRRGLILAEARTLLWRFVDDVEVRVSLDEMGMTRVDLRSSSRVGRVDFGVNARRIARFLAALDRELQRRPPRG